ncbi:MAG: ATP-binding protein [Thiobacillus sp.]
MSILRLAPFLLSLKKRVQARPDTEFQQTAVRLCIVVGFYLYFSLGWVEHSPAMADQVHFLGLTLTSISLFLMIGALLDPGVSVTRRGIGMAHDFTVATYMLALSGESGAPLVATYLWVTLGNGFRYGIPYLLVSTVAAATGFAAVYLISPFWQAHPSLWWGLWLTLVVIPLYAISLLRQLHNAVRREKEASKAKSNFLANMSHELRTPLNGVIGVADLLAETKLNTEQKEFAQIIRASADTLLELIDNVLDISRIEAGRTLTSNEDFDLHRVINGTVAMMETQANAKGLVLAAHVAPQTPFHLHGDVRHLRQVLINLIGNAVKFTEHGRVDVYVRPVGQGNPQRLRLEVVDTGIGIPLAAQTRIFDTFTQADASITRRFGGTGLGTTIAKQLVEAMGGEIGLHSREGEGTTFWFELPFALHNVEAPSEERFDTPMRVAILAGGELAERTGAAIQAWGAETVSLQGRTQLGAAVSASRSGDAPFAAIIVESSLLAEDPVAFLGHLREGPARSPVPVILIESDPRVPSSHDAQLLRDGYASVLRAPVHTSLLFNAIHAATSRDLPSNVVSLADRFKSQTGHLTGLNILIAEDNPVNQRVLRGLLEHAGHKTTLARDGEEAVDLLESDSARFDLAIIDMHMPELSGPEVVQRWRFLEKGHLPIIMLTADARGEAEAACREAGVDAFLTKPVNSRELVDTITRLAAPSSSSVAASAPTAARACELDETVLDDLAELGGAEFVRELLASFEDDSARALRDTEVALTTQDYAQWHHHLHMLKGGASDVGANLLAQRCVEAERIKPFELATPLAQTRLDAVRMALQEARDALARYQEQRLRAESI